MSLKAVLLTTARLGENMSLVHRVWLRILAVENQKPGKRLMSRDDSLEMFQDLLLQGPVDGQPQLRKALLELAVGPWRQANDVDDLLAFNREASEGLNAASLVLFLSPEGFKVTNIVPRDVHELGITAYNMLINDFVEKVARPAAEKSEFKIEITPSRQNLEDLMSEDAAFALRRFSAAANRGTGSSHPSDQKRWFGFLINAHQGDASIDAALLVRWLTKVESWPSDVAHDLGVEYEFARKLLSEYDRRGA